MVEDIALNMPPIMPNLANHLIVAHQRAPVHKFLAHSRFLSFPLLFSVISVNICNATLPYLTKSSSQDYFTTVYYLLHTFLQSSSSSLWRCALRETCSALPPLSLPPPPYPLSPLLLPLAHWRPEWVHYHRRTV